jgi:hypothetical protein
MSAVPEVHHEGHEDHGSSFVFFVPFLVTSSSMKQRNIALQNVILSPPGGCVIASP